MVNNQNTIVYHQIPWYLMIYHGIFMVYHGTFSYRLVQNGARYNIMLSSIQTLTI